MELLGEAGVQGPEISIKGLAGDLVIEAITATAAAATHSLVAECRACIHAPDADSTTALMFAVSRGHDEMHGPCLLLTEALQKIAQGALEDMAPLPKHTLAMRTYCSSAALV